MNDSQVVMECLTPIKVKDLKKYQWFTRKPILEPKAEQVFIREDYDRSTKRYYCMRFSDINSCISLRGETIVYTGFTF